MYFIVILHNLRHNAQIGLLYTCVNVCYNIITVKERKTKRKSLDCKIKIRYNISTNYIIKGGDKVVYEMTGREVVNLIDKLRSEGLDDTKIIEIIKYIELNDPKNNTSTKLDNN